MVGIKLLYFSPYSYGIQRLYVIFFCHMHTVVYTRPDKDIFLYFPDDKIIDFNNNMSLNVERK